MSDNRLTPLFWQDSRLVPMTSLDPLDQSATGLVTILHTNDFHSSVDARPGSSLGGITRIASTIDAYRAAGPTLVVDSGDSVYGGGTWWCAQDAGPTSRLFALAGYEVAAIGNHDLEHGARSLWELVNAGRRLVSTNLTFDDSGLQRQIPPAYIAEVGGLRIGILGLTTLMTLLLVPRSVMEGVRYLETFESARRAAAALEPMVHTIIVLSHLGFDNDVDSDVHLIPFLRGSSVSAILGGHTHDALDPAYVIDGIVTCNAGAHGVNVNRVTVARDADGSITVRAKLLPQDVTVAESDRLVVARQQEADALAPLQQRVVSLPRGSSVANGERSAELALLREAVRESGTANADSVLMVPYLYLVGELPTGATVSRLEVLTAYPNAEELVQFELSGSSLRELIRRQAGFRFFLSSSPVWLASGSAVDVDLLQDDRTYTVVSTQLVAEGGLDWAVPATVGPTVRTLGVTCADVVWGYLETASLPGGKRTDR